jgi:hypothetical protein
MTTFDEREKGFEAKYKYDQELRFKVNARRNRLLGLWAAGKMAITGGEAETYARSVVAADFEKPGDDDVVEKIIGDLKAKGIAIDAHGVRREMDRLVAIAMDQISKEVK